MSEDEATFLSPAPPRGEFLPDELPLTDAAGTGAETGVPTSPFPAHLTDRGVRLLHAAVDVHHRIDRPLQERSAVDSLVRACR